MTALPEDTHLAYSLPHEAYYAATPGIVGGPMIYVSASAQGSGGGVAWEFSVKAIDLGRNSAIRVDIFDDAFAAFAQIPEFFAALAANDIDTLDKVTLLLQHMGAVDETKRTDPDTPSPEPVSPVVRLKNALDGAAIAHYGTGRDRVLIIPEDSAYAIARSVAKEA